jgi:hypothetical protein
VSATPTFADCIRTQFEQRLGRLTIEFAKLEVDLGCAIGSLVSTDVRVGHSLSSELSFKAKLALLASLWRGAADVALHADFDTWRKAAEQVEAARNRLIHSFYWPGTLPGELVRYKTTAKLKKGLNFQTEPVTGGHLDKVLRELEEVVQDLIALMMKQNSDYSLYAGRFWGKFTAERTKPQQGATPNGGPATLLGNSAVTGGPPSVS